MTEAGGITVRYRPPGRVAARFFNSRKKAELIMGPVGSGKTSCALMKNVQLAQEQRPSTKDGRRKYKFCVVRDTYRQLWKTTIPSWHKWMSKGCGIWTGAQDGPASHRIVFQLHDGQVIDLHAEFVAIGEHRVEDVLRGYEVTSFYLNEADLLDKEVFNYATTRTGRFPPMDEGGPSWHGVLADMNAPDTENYTYDMFVDNLPDEWAFFRQPSGFSPNAENIENLPADYYKDMAVGKEKWFIRRMIENKFGYSRDGQPVYEDWNDDFHVAEKELVPVRGLPLKIGLDAGLMPAAIIEQRMANGQWRCLHELVMQRTGPVNFGEALARLLKEKFTGFTVTAWADPSAGYGTDKDPNAGEKTWIQIVAAKTGLRIRPAPTNKLIPRLEAVRAPLTRLIDGHLPGFLLCPINCKVLRKGFNSGYRYRRVHIVGREVYSEDPEKNEWSHPHDGLQYVQSGGGEHAEVMGRKKDHQRLLRQTHAVTDDDPLGRWRPRPLDDVDALAGLPAGPFRQRRALDGD